MEKLEYGELICGHNSISWKTVNALEFCDFEKLRSLFYFEMNHLELFLTE